MIWDIIEKKLVDADLGVEDETIFRLGMPATVKVGIMTKSPLTGIAINPNLPNFYKPTLQLIVRHYDPVEGQALADAVIKALTVTAPESYEANDERGAAKISVFYPRELPIQFPRLDGNGIEWSLNFITAFTVLPKA